MAVRKPLEKMKQEEIDVDALIDKGSTVKEDRMQKHKKWCMINLRISSEMLKYLDDCVNKRVGITRTGWILESIHEKINKEI